MWSLLIVASQGDIESVAALSPKDLTGLIEQVSGSAAFKKEYDRCEAEKATVDEQMSFVFSKKKAVVAEKRQKKEQKEEAEKHIRMQKELVKTTSSHSLLRNLLSYKKLVPPYRLLIANCTVGSAA